VRGLHLKGAGSPPRSRRTVRFANRTQAPDGCSNAKLARSGYESRDGRYNSTNDCNHAVIPISPRHSRRTVCPNAEPEGESTHYILRPDGSLLVVIVTVSGHGIALGDDDDRNPVAFIGTARSDAGDSVGLLTQVNRLDRRRHAATTPSVIYRRPVRPERHTDGLRQCRASRYLPLTNRSRDQTQTDKPAVGITPDETSTASEVDTFEPGDLLALFTDGISEATPRSRWSFSENDV